MKIIVSGGRDFNLSSFVFSGLNMVNKQYGIEEIVQGGASGVDKLAQTWADIHNIPCKTYLPNWLQYGKGAGPIRNRQMLDKELPDCVVLFPGGNGTTNMRDQAKRAGVRTIEVDFYPVLREEGVKNVLPKRVA